VLDQQAENVKDHIKHLIPEVDGRPGPVNPYAAQETSGTKPFTRNYR